MTALETLLHNLEAARKSATQGDQIYEFEYLCYNHILQLIEIIRVQKKALDKMICSPVQYMDSEDYFTIAHEVSVKVEEIAGKK